MREKLEKFYAEERETYIKYVFHRAGGWENAEDVVQEAFLRALLYLDTYDPNSTMEQWFSTILRRALYDFKKDDMRQGMVSETDTGEVEAAGASGEDIATAEEIEKAIVETANPVHRQILYLYFLRNYPLRDIVQVLDVGYHNARTVLNRWKIGMKERYAQ